MLPLAVVVVFAAVAVLVQPGGSSARTSSEAPSLKASASEDTPVAASPTAAPAKSPSATPGRQGAAGGTTPSADVAGVRATPSGSATAAAPEPDLSHDSTQCGSIQETALALSIEQAIAGVSVRVTRAAVYPIEYFRCIMMATGGREAVSLATSIAKVQKEGATHVVLVDLWVANGGKEFGQVNLKTATLSVAGQTFPPLATLGGRGEVVVSSGEGRNVTLVATLKNTVGATTGPMTLTIDPPLAGGKKTQGKYQLFLPTP